MPTSFPMSIPHAPTGTVNQAAMDTAFTTPINDLYAIAAAAGQGYVGDQATGANVTLSTTSAFASTTTVPFTLTSTRRVRFDTSATYQAATAGGGHCIFRAGYNSGGSAVIGSFLGVGNNIVVTTATTGANGGVSGSNVGTVLLTAGTYTAYISCTRAGGGATDIAALFYVLVTDIGAV